MFTSKEFQLYADKVVQGPYVAEAQSPTHLRSTYQSPANQTFSRLIEFKFSLNGKDNELPVGVNHRLVLQPEGGKVLSPLITFGQVSGGTAQAPSDFLEPNTQVTFQLDMRPVLEAFQKQGFYTSPAGEKLFAQDFKGVYIAGGAEPLSWDFENLPSRPQFQLTDPDQDGIYTITLAFNAHHPKNFTASEWKLKEDISGLPQFTSDQVLLSALYNLSLEEMLLDIRPDSTFMAGAQWNGVWTRDISYSILLSLAAVAPQVCQNSLRHKVKDGRIVQDTGTGGSWPISSDRMTWALAAWEVYKVTGDQDWLREAYQVLKKSAEEDLATIVDHGTGLMRGESSFLDWRKQTYPLWMEPVDIYQSLSLGTNAVHYQTYRILEQMAHNLGEEYNPVYRQTYSHLKKGMNQHLWAPEKQYYGQFLYGRQHLGLSPRAEGLGEALAILFEVADEKRSTRVLDNTPQTNFGIPSIYPYIPEVPPYHNNSMWPFVQAYWTWAAAQHGHTAKVAQSMAALYRAAAMILTNKENLVAETGDFKGTEINSDRQLWSVAGNLAMVYRVFFGMEFTSKSLSFKPVVPASFAGKKTLSNFKYRRAILHLELEGHGTQLKGIYLDGKSVSKAEIPANLTGEHTLKMVLAGDEGVTTPANLVNHAFSPKTPQVSFQNGQLSWSTVPGAASYQVVKNGAILKTIEQPSLKIAVPKKGADEYQVKAIGKDKTESFLSEPVLVAAPSSIQSVELGTSSGQKVYNALGFSGDGYVHISKREKTSLSWQAEVAQAGIYSLDFRYANGNGPINTDNKASIRTLILNKQPVGAVVFPQRGVDEWSNWGYSNSWQVYLPKGRHSFTLTFEPHNENMNGEVNEALLDQFRLIYLREK